MGAGWIMPKRPKPLRPSPEPQPRGAKIHGSRPVDQAEAAARFIAAPEHAKMHDERLWDLRQKRDREMHGMTEWEELRALASAIKEHTLTHLDEYLEQFEANALANGIHVHWARDAAEHNHIVHGILSDHARAGAEYIVSADTSCLMHQKGCAERIGVPIKFIHIAQILNGANA